MASPAKIIISVPNLRQSAHLSNLQPYSSVYLPVTKVEAEDTGASYEGGFEANILSTTAD